MQAVHIHYLNGPDIESLGITDAEVLQAIEGSLASQGRGECVIEPRMHLNPRAGVDGHFNVLRGAIGAPIHMAGVKVVGDFVDNYRQDLPSEVGMLTLFDPRTG
ncbi:MAG: ornithine cyclodeaminase family protein, partial [Betaproteobacteria bacterium]